MHQRTTLGDVVIDVLQDGGSAVQNAAIRRCKTALRLFAADFLRLYAAIEILQISLKFLGFLIYRYYIVPIDRVTKNRDAIISSYAQ